MENLVTLGYVLKVFALVLLYLAFQKMYKKFWIRKINIETEAQLLKYIFKNHSILDFDESIDIFSSAKNKINITNNISHIMISYDEVLHIYNYIVEDIHFSSNSKFVKITGIEYQSIVNAIEDLGLDNFKPKQ